MERQLGRRALQWARKVAGQGERKVSERAQFGADAEKPPLRDNDGSGEERRRGGGQGPARLRFLPQGILLY